MSELRVNNIVSEDGSAAPVYSRGMNIGSGTTLTCDGNFVVGGATSIAGTVEVGGLFKANTLTPLTGDTVTISSGKFLAVGGGVTVTNAGTFTVSGPTSFQSGAVVTGVVTFTEADLQSALSVTALDVGSNIKLGNAGVITATSFSGDGSALTGIDATTIVNGTSNVTVAASGDITVTRAGTTRLTVHSAGATVNGTLSSDGITIGDGDQIVVGDSNDFRIFHDGSRSIVQDQGTGSLEVLATNFLVKNAADNKNAIYAVDGGATILYHNGVEKITTTSGGIDVTGTAACDGLDCQGNATVNGGFNCTGTVTVGQSQNASYITMFDADEGSRQIHCNTNYIGFLTQAGGWGARCDDNGHWLPGSNNAMDLGNSSFRWRNIYTNDLNLSNEGSANDVDGTWGDWTIQEGENDLFIINRRNGKKFKINLTEVN